jgi:L-lactate dehydrogenase
MKISIIGAGGRVGSNTAFTLQCLGLGRELVLIDANRAAAEGEALDILHGAAFTSSQIVRAGEDRDLDGSDIIIITAGLRRQPDEPRLALINRNVGLFDGIMGSIKKAALPSRCILIVVTNPVDILTQVAVERSGFSPEKVLGLGTVLDTLRFRSLLAQELQADPRQVSALILGEHGDSMVPVWSTATVNGVPLTSLKGYDQQKVWQIFVRAQNSGAEVLKKKGGAGYAVGIAIAEVVKAILTDSGALLPVSTMQTGLYGIRDVCLSVPTKVGAAGALQTVEMELWPKERSALSESAAALKATWGQVQQRA